MPERKSIRLPRINEPIGAIRVIGQDSSPHEDLYHSLLSASWRGFFAAIGVVYLLANAFFAGLYLLVPGSIQGARPGVFEDAFFFSVQTMATIGYGGMVPANRYANALVTFEALVGMISMALVTGISFARFARPTARVLFCEKLVISQRNGAPHLMARMANWRNNHVVEAEVRLIVLFTETTREGETMRRQVDLPLVRSRTSFFRLTFVVMHPIVEGSPFFGEGALERLKACDAQILVTLTGLDETLSQTIHARHAYPIEAVIPDARFADVISVGEGGIRTLDYTNFHEVIRA